MKALRMASFGIRGFVGGAMTPDVCIDFASAFATFTGGRKILIARDTRYSSDMIHAAAVSGLLSAGCDVIDFGVCPTPILQYSVVPYGAAGAISISGGHTGMGWNSITLIGPDGAFLSPLGGENVLDFYHSGDFIKRDWQGMGIIRPDEAFITPYFDALENYLDADAIRAANFTVLIDPVGGAGCSYLEPFAQRLGLKLVPVNATASGYLARDPEPRPRTTGHLGSFIHHVNGSIGFALTSDMGRLSIVTETGETVSEELTFPLIARHVLTHTPGDVVANCCTSRAVDDVAHAAGHEVYKTPVGQANIIARLVDEEAVVGGEGNGSVCVPAFSRSFDGFLMMGLILEAMAISGLPISTLLSRLPRYAIHKTRIPTRSTRGSYSELNRLVEHLRSIGEADNVTTTDGVRIDYPDGWVHARVSRTQNMIRIISEAETRERALQLSDVVMRIVQAES